MMDTAIPAEFFDGHDPLGVPVILAVDGQDLVVSEAAVSRRFPISAVRVSPRVAQTPRFVATPTGEQLLCTDSVWLDALPAEVSSEGPVAWLERRWGVALSCVWLIAAVLVLGYIYGLPRAATAIAKRIPPSAERAMGERMLAAMDAQHLMRPSTLDRFVAEGIQRDFAKLTANSPIVPPVRLELRASFIGANALALPGGIVVATDDLVRLASPDELTAVLAHEFGHVLGRHSLRNLIQSSGVTLVLAAAMGDATSISAALGSVPLALSASYSRDLEAEADEFAFKFLDDHGISPNAFASVMEKLASEHSGPSSHGFLDSHPATEERIRRAQQAAQKTKH